MFGVLPVYITKNWVWINNEGTGFFMILSSLFLIIFVEKFLTFESYVEKKYLSKIFICLKLTSLFFLFFASFTLFLIGRFFAGS